MKKSPAIDITDFLELRKAGNPVIDVRSPAEFEAGHIPGACNIPLFSNKERAEIGTLYKQQGQEAAILRGLEIVGPKMADFVRQAKALPFKNQLLVHCWRGGMRSGSFGWLLNTAGLPAATLTGGYKSYRNHLLDFFGTAFSLLILTGGTGNGKTELLHHLQQKGEQVIDLEGLAHHKGSVFGGMGQQEQPSSEQFQNELFLQMKEMDISRPIWLEDESISLGNVFIPHPLWNQLRRAPLVRVELALPLRIERLVREYGNFPPQMLAEAIEKLGKRLGGQHAKAALEALQQNNLTEVAAILLVYYDKAYQQGIDKRKELLCYEAAYDFFDPEAISEDILKHVWKTSN
ncbi:tRNA 2-selenouridine(34) synthase MnmH [Nafulsella turpanensis]|uniref:tRNA 2-selenouridine(34) synthase MnmH n=1 Tax=Nafulsella turpanensis TaxID=1265690 RepID=UPI00058BC9B9|nr:tRNA 2-selenouridine(34) synthase MnmH [Nafulsella turpanensis]